MKRQIALFFLLTFLFHAGGYYGFFRAFHYHAGRALAQRVDTGRYASDETLILSIPLSLPYPVHHGDYERTQTSVEYNGSYYTVMKQKVNGDTLLLVCLRNVQQNRLALAMNDYAKAVNNLPGAAQRTLSLLGKFFKDYQPAAAIITLNHRTTLPPWQQVSPVCTTLLAAAYPVISPPPKTPA